MNEWMRVYHKKLSVLVTGIVWWGLEFLISSFFWLLSGNTSIGLYHARGRDVTVLHLKMERMWLAICAMISFLPNLFRCSPCLVKRLLSLLQSRNLILGDILASLDSFLLILRTLEFTIVLFCRSYLKGMLSTTMFVCVKGERYSLIKHQVQHSSILGPVLCLLYANDFLWKQAINVKIKMP